MTSKRHGGKSHSGIPGSKAACAYPGRYRGLPRPSSALKPSHPPDGVFMSGRMVVSVWRLVNTIFWCVVILAYAWCHSSYILIPPFTLHQIGVELHLMLIGYSILLNCFRSPSQEYKDCVVKYKAF